MGHRSALIHTDLPFKEVARRLDRAGIVWAVFAGAAATAYGVTRPLTDIDILVPAVEGDRVTALFPEARVVYRRDGRAGEIKMPGVGKHDWEDVRAMLAHLPALDWDYLRWRADTCGADERAQQALERLMDEEQALKPGLGD